MSPPARSKSLRQGRERARFGLGLNRGAKASQVLRIERAQGCRDSGSNSNDSFFNGWAK